MAVPKRRMSRSRQGSRRSHHHLTPMQEHYCAQCGQRSLPHRVCAECGFYHGREVEKQEEKTAEK